MQETTSPGTPQGTPPSLRGGSALKNMSYLLLLVTFIGIGALFTLSWMSQGKTQDINNEIHDLDARIQTISADRNIVVAKIIQDNDIRPSIDLKNLVTQFRLAAIKANVAFDGFAIKDDVISTKLISTQGNNVHPDAVATIIDMMNEYARTTQAFSLGDITMVSGDPTKRSTTIELTVANPPIQ